MKRTPLKRKTALKAKTGLNRSPIRRIAKKKATKKKPKRALTTAKLLKKVQDVFNRYVRTRAAVATGGWVACCSCGQVHDWKELDAGHYIHGCSALRYDERNVHPQCTACNRFRHGNATGYAAYLVKRYGPDIILYLDEIKRQNKEAPKRWRRPELRELLETYTQKLKELNQP